MGVIHFLNVNEGDCILVKHPSGHNTIAKVYKIIIMLLIISNFNGQSNK